MRGMGDDRTFEVIEAVDSLPRTTRKADGFSRGDVVNAFQRAFTMIGGVQRLALWANANPDKFYMLYAKLLPSTSINIGDNRHVHIIHAIPPSPLDVHPSGDNQVQGRVRESLGDQSGEPDGEVQASGGERVGRRDMEAD
jgi:hypothetical protein